MDSKMTDDFIAEMVKSEDQALIYLMNGIKLTGKILSSDSLSIIMTAEKSKGGKGQLVFRSAISTIKPE
jgi:RNA chaperone Hfq